MNDNPEILASTEVARINRPAIGPARFLRNVIEIGTVDQAMEVAKMMAIAKQAVPKHLRNEPGMCLAVVMQAKEWEMAPYAVARKSYVVNDTLAYESQLIHAVIEARAPIKTRLNCRYEGEGPTRRCIVVGTFNGDEESRDYTSPQIGNIKIKNSPLWASDPDQQLFYYSSRAWCRKWCPDVLLGVYAPDEIAIGSDNALPVIHNPLQDDAERPQYGASSNWPQPQGEPGDEVPPKRVAETMAAVIDEVVATADRECEDEFDEPVAETPQAKPPRRPRAKAQDAPKPEEASGAASGEKAAPAPSPGAQDWRKLPAPALAKLSGADYLAYLAKWTADAIEAKANPEIVRGRFSIDERDVRNRLGSMLDQDQLAEAKRIATDAFKKLGGV